mgnify:CR=1 FL=1
MKVSVIIPVYKVERFIVRCAVSLMEQTLKEVEYIFVDDATPDKSVCLLQEVIEHYPDRKRNVILLHHSTNQGLPAARNTGLSIAKGEYVYHCDSDDFVESDMLEQLYIKANQCNADIVWCDWWLSFAKNERYMSQPEYFTPMEALKGMLSGVMKYNVWNKLVRRSLYVENNIKFPSGYGMGEDMTMIRLFARAQKVAYLPKAFYHYVQLNMGAFSKTYSDRHLVDIKHNIDVILDDLKVLFGKKLEKEMAFFQLDVKFPFLITDDISKYQLWQSWFPEVNVYIMQNKRLSLRSRCLQWLAWKHQFWIIRLHYICVYRFVYGIIYR